MRFRSLVAVALVSLVAILVANGTAEARSDEATIQLAGEVLQEFLDLRVKEIPAALLADSEGVAIIPDVIKVGLVLGGQRGKGVVIFREKGGTWRAPMFVTITGGSVGWQAGAQSSDIVLVFKTQKSVEGLMRGKFTLGADAAVAAGPVGRRAAAATDGELKAEIYSYSRTRGLFAGLSIDGSALQIDDRANAEYYGRVDAAGVPPPVPQPALKLVELVAKLTTASDPAEQPTPLPMGEPAGPVLGVPMNAVPMPADPALRPAADAAADADALRAELARAASSLSPLLDDAWKRYLALPVEVSRGGQHPAPESVIATIRKFDTVAANRQYQTLAERPEFQATRDRLRAYANVLVAPASPQLALPPPPGVEQR